MPRPPDPERDEPTKMSGDPETIFRALMRVDPNAKSTKKPRAKKATRKKK